MRDYEKEKIDKETDPCKVRDRKMSDIYNTTKKHVERKRKSKNNRWRKKSYIEQSRE